jgi:hypothetical protein
MQLKFSYLRHYLHLEISVQRKYLEASNGSGLWR